MPVELPPPNTLEEAKAQIDALKGLVAQLMHRLDTLSRNHFGQKSEKFVPGQALLDFPGFEEALKRAGMTAEQFVHAPPQPARGATAAQPRHSTRLPAGLIPEDVVHDLPESEKCCEKCRHALTKIGEESRLLLDYVPGRIQALNHVRLKYACKACEQCVKLAPGPVVPVPGGIAGAGLLAHTLISKFDDHLPLHRQAEMLQRLNVKLPKSTLCGWVGQSAELLAPLYALMRELVLQGKVIQTDDTHVNYQLGKGHGAAAKPLSDEADAQSCLDLEGNTDGQAEPKSPSKRKLISKGYVWAYIGDEQHPYCVFDFTTSRSREGPMNFLGHAPPGNKAFRGYLQADAYSGYEEVFRTTGDEGKPLVLEVACWAHARRYFFDAQNSQDKELAQAALAMIGKLYDVERVLKESGAAEEEIARVRGERARPLLDAMGAWLEQHKGKVLPKSPMGQAIHYALGNWTALNRYIERGYLSIDNNASERALRNVVIGRKNWLFAGSEAGGRWAAVAYTLIESAKRCGANVWEYLRDVIERIPTTRLSQLQDLLPDHWLKARRAQPAPQPEPQA